MNEDTGHLTLRSSHQFGPIHQKFAKGITIINPRRLWFLKQVMATGFGTTE
ncbi:MAG: hypothetical protein MUF13_07100 [Akkermansiaceae bacterium]|jgi:hypothetical protein|nr:hypothetical protein [Akkermansiaceae bacterium]